jgi:flagellar hook-basal body complex protein FliE
MSGINSINVNQLLAQMRVLEAQAQAKPAPVNEPGMGVQKTDFSNILAQSINSVNDVSKHASKMATAFEKGDTNVSLAELMISMEKSSVSFQAMSQVRNKLLSAYKEIMSMPV